MCVIVYNIQQYFLFAIVIIIIIEFSVIRTIACYIPVHSTDRKSPLSFPSTFLSIVVDLNYVVV